MYRTQSQTIVADDPNLALYKQVIAAQGGPGPLYVARASYYAVPPAPSAGPSAPDEAALLEARLAREEEAFEQRNRQWEAERIAWLESHRQAWRDARPYAIAYAQPAPQGSFDQEPVPPPPPAYSGPTYYYAPAYAAPAYPGLDEGDERWERPGWYQPGR